MRRGLRHLLISAAASVLLVGHADRAAGDEAAPFFKGRSIDMIISTPPGGGYDAYARLMVRHLGKHIPGNPGLIPKNLPGASGTKALEFLYSMAPHDGATIGAVHPGNLLEPILRLSNKRVEYDSARFLYLGSANVETSLCILRAGAPVKSFEEAMSKQAILGASGTSTLFYPASHNAFLGTKFKLIVGYNGTETLNLAMERGEIDGFCGQFWSSVNTQNPEWIGSDKYNIIVQEAMKGTPALDRMGVPLVYKFVKSDDDRKALDLLYGPLVFGRPYVSPPATPAERVAVLRAAFDAALRDDALLADAAKMRLPIEPTSGADVEALVMQLLATPAPIVKRLTAALPREE